jgi:hypothetical protein
VTDQLTPNGLHELSIIYVNGDHRPLGPYSPSSASHSSAQSSPVQRPVSLPTVLYAPFPPTSHEDPSPSHSLYVPYSDSSSPPPQIAIAPPLIPVQNLHISFMHHNLQDPLESHAYLSPAGFVPQPSPDLGFHSHQTTNSAQGSVHSGESPTPTDHSWSQYSVTVSFDGRLQSTSPSYTYASPSDWSPSPSFMSEEYEARSASGSRIELPGAIIPRRLQQHSAEISDPAFTRLF